MKVNAQKNSKFLSEVTYDIIVSVYFSPVLSWLQYILCALPQQCLAQQRPGIISSRNESKRLQFQNSNPETLHQHYLAVGYGIEYTGRFKFGSGCNLSLYGYQLNVVGNCDIKVFISPNQHTDESSPRQINGKPSIRCSHTRFCLIDWRADTVHPLHLSGKTVTIRLTNNRESRCTVSSRLRNKQFVWDGVILTTEGIVNCHTMVLAT